MQLSVIICSHNPSQEYLERTLEALHRQDLPQSEWELILVDNASNPALESRFDIKWHPSGRIVSEPNPGLTPARLKGIQEAAGNLLVFVDDDNVLYPDYLKETLNIRSQFSVLGAWGGQIFPEFEVEPTAEMADFVPYLALRKVEKARWTNCDSSMTCCPYGAGLCVRANVAARYVDKLATQPIFRGLDRRGQSLMGGGDVDLAVTSFQLGLGIGLFPQLKMTHLISRARVEPDYLYRLVVAGNYSGRLVSLLNNASTMRESQSGVRKWVKTSTVALKLLRSTGRLEKTPHYYKAATTGVSQAEADYGRIQSGGQPVGIDGLAGLKL